MGIQPLPSRPSLDEGPSEAQTSMPQMELTRDVWDPNDDQMQEVLEALQIKMTQEKGVASLLGLPQIIQGSLEAEVKL